MLQVLRPDSAVVNRCRAVNVESRRIDRSCKELQRGCQVRRRLKVCGNGGGCGNSFSRLVNAYRTVLAAGKKNCERLAARAGSTTRAHWRACDGQLICPFVLTLCPPVACS